MKKLLWILLLSFVGWLGYVKWINPDSAYPWEYFSSAANVEETLAWKSYSNCWESFRLNFPYHIQTIGVSDFAQDGSRIIIISEPPSHFRNYEVAEIFAHFKSKSDIKTNPLGYDGWVKDYILVVSGGSERQQKRALETLYKYVYQSDYKPHYLDLTKKPVRRFNEGGQNYSISAAEIKNWFVDGDDKWFVPAEKSGGEETLSNLMSNNKYGVFYSKSPGFVHTH